jgi:hypothetical protein
MLSNDHVRVQIRAHPPAQGKVTVTSYSTREVGDYGLRGEYESFDKLPQWMQTKIIKLQILPDPPPRLDVHNLGSKITSTIYWVVAPEDETHGHDAGE